MPDTFWLQNGKLVMDAQGRPILCDHCPCEVDCEQVLAYVDVLHATYGDPEAEDECHQATVHTGGYVIQYPSPSSCLDWNPDDPSYTPRKCPPPNIIPAMVYMCFFIPDPPPENPEDPQTETLWFLWVDCNCVMHMTTEYLYYTEYEHDCTCLAEVVLAAYQNLYPEGEYHVGGVHSWPDPDDPEGLPLYQAAHDAYVFNTYSSSIMEENWYIYWRHCDDPCAGTISRWNPTTDWYDENDEVCDCPLLAGFIVHDARGHVVHHNGALLWISKVTDTSIPECGNVSIGVYPALAHYEYPVGTHYFVNCECTEIVTMTLSEDNYYVRWLDYEDACVCFNLREALEQNADAVGVVDIVDGNRALYVENGTYKYCSGWIDMYGGIPVITRYDWTALLNLDGTRYMLNYDAFGYGHCWGTNNVYRMWQVDSGTAMAGNADLFTDTGNLPVTKHGRFWLRVESQLYMWGIFETYEIALEVAQTTTPITDCFVNFYCPSYEWDWGGTEQYTPNLTISETHMEPYEDPDNPDGYWVAWAGGYTGDILNVKYMYCDDGLLLGNGDTLNGCFTIDFPSIIPALGYPFNNPGWLQGGRFQCNCGSPYCDNNNAMAFIQEEQTIVCFAGHDPEDSGNSPCLPMSGSEVSDPGDPFSGIVF